MTYSGQAGLVPCRISRCKGDAAGIVGSVVDDLKSGDVTALLPDLSCTQQQLTDLKTELLQVRQLFQSASNLSSAAFVTWLWGACLNSRIKRMAGTMLRVLHVHLQNECDDTCDRESELRDLDANIHAKFTLVCVPRCR